MFGTLGLIWGSSFLLMAIGLDSFHPGFVALLRIVAASVVRWASPPIRLRRFDRAVCWRVVLVGVTWVAMPFTMLSIAHQWIAAGVAGRFNGTTLNFAMLVASIVVSPLPG